jgi:EAL domain-containing protein (putative c-di-GMP-specific phosphodiesterase class I)
MEPVQSVLTPPPGIRFTGNVLVVDDEPALRRANGRILEAVGFTVVQATDGLRAVEALEEQRFDAIVTDICMPGMNGIQLLRKIREKDADVPVLLLTANPGIESAVQAIEHGALRYLIKPVGRAELVKNVSEAVNLGRIARMRRDNARHAAPTGKVFGDRAAMDAGLSRGLATLWMAYQPIVNWKTQHVVAHEALLRTEEPTLPNPDVLLSAAQKLGRLHEVGRAVRARVAQDLVAHPRVGDVFVNLHPADLVDDELYSPAGPLAPFARQIVLEITEREALDPKGDIPGCAARLRALGYRLAIDDLGAGYSGLSYFAQLTPEVAKIDMSLVRNIHEEEIKRKLVASLIILCRDLGLIVIAEGVETAAERDAIAALGCEWFQGYLFAKPGKPYPAVTW